MTESLSEPMPRKLWFLWLQGLDNAPLVVHRCLDSWQRWNPDWGIEILDWVRLEGLLPEHPHWLDRWRQMHPTAASNLIRLNLLYRHGGVWTDATCLCRKPLDCWLPDLMRTGFFAFSAPASDRELSTWFLAARPHLPLISRWRDVAHAYWERHPGRAVVPIDELLTAPEWAPFRAERWRWFDETRPVYSVRYPYFWTHYLFEGLLEDPQFAEQWRGTPKVTADIPHRLQQVGLGTRMSEAMIREWEGGVAPLYNMTYKADLRISEKKTVFGYCMERENWGLSDYGAGVERRSARYWLRALFGSTPPNEKSG